MCLNYGIVLKMQSAEFGPLLVFCYKCIVSIYIAVINIHLGDACALLQCSVLQS